MKRWLAVRAARVLLRFIVDENYRNAALVRLNRPRNLFQPDNFTMPDRYPKLFRLAARLVGDGPEIRILSFGCSTGEEVFALRAHFPHAWIEGVDINRHNIAICNRKLARIPDPKITFRVAGSIAGAEASLFDAIFCMAVFRHGALGDSVRTCCDGLIRFEDFDREISHLARSLRAGGLLFVEWCNFRFCDTSVSAEFEKIFTAPPAPDGKEDPIYDRHNRLIPGLCYREVAFRKGSGAHQLHAGET